MAITKTTQVARKIMNKGKGTYLFNDRLVDGRRSLKVWGWTDSDYRKAKREQNRDDVAETRREADSVHEGHAVLDRLVV